MTFPASYQTRYFSDFLLSEGLRYRELIPNAELVLPNQSGKIAGWRGWAFKLKKLNTDFPIRKEDKGMGTINKDVKYTYIETDSKD